MDVTVLARKGRSLLIEWTNEEGRQRSYVPVDSVYDKQGKMVCDLAEQGIPYGVPWGLLAQQLPPIDGQVLQTELRRQGVWTVDDLKLNRNAVISAIQQTVGLSVNQLLRQAEAYLQGVNNE